MRKSACCDRQCKQKAIQKRNPFPIEYRKRLVENVLQEEDLSGADVKVMTLSDWSMEDAAQYVKEWGSFFYYNIANEIGEKSFTFYYNDDPKIAENWFTDDIFKECDHQKPWQKRY